MTSTSKKKKTSTSFQSSKMHVGGIFIGLESLRGENYWLFWQRVDIRYSL